MRAGASPMRVLFVSNLAYAAWALPLFFVFPGVWEWTGFFGAAGAGAALFFGRICMVNALKVGDLSVVGPLLATKTLFVAVFSLVSRTDQIGTLLLVSSVLATVGVALLQVGPVQHVGNWWKVLLLSLGASLFFALTDVLVQAFAGRMGIGYFQPLMFLAVCALLPVVGRGKPAPEDAKTPLGIGSSVMGLQTVAVLATIGLTGHATLVNIVYSGRIFWVVAVDYWTGGEGIRRFFLFRLAGATMLLGAVVLVIWK